VIEALAADNKRIAINWAIADPSLPKPAVKVLLNLAQIGLDALVRGGTLDIGAERRDGAVEIVARARGDRIVFDETIGRALQGDLAEGEITSRTAAAHMIAVVAEEMDGGLQYKLGDGVLVLGAALPEPEGMIG
jgi:histidine phosphotransferase ChpT